MNAGIEVVPTKVVEDFLTSTEFLILAGYPGVALPDMAVEAMFVCKIYNQIQLGYFFANTPVVGFFSGIPNILMGLRP